MKKWFLAIGIEFNKIFKVGIYIRLSREDGDKLESDSISNQRDILQRYIKENRLISKDLSRLGRDYIKTGYYIENYFPEKNVRYVSILDEIDTFIDSTNNDVTPFKAIINDMYAKDISKKIKGVLREKELRGEYLGSIAPYGYRKSKTHKNKLEIDENVSYVIEKIFELYSEGNGTQRISNILDKEGIDPPSKYLNQKHQRTTWSPKSIRAILVNEAYIGNTVQNKCVSVSYKVKKRKPKNENEYIRVQNTHEAIIKPEVFEEVQRIKGNIAKEDLKAYVYLLKGLVFCKNCGRKMTYKNSKPIRIDKNGKVTGKKNELGYFICTEHYRHKNICNEWVKIMENDLNNIVLNKISKRLKDLQLEKYENDVMTYKEMIVPKLNESKKIAREICKIESDFKVLYLKKVEEIISEEEFIVEYNKYQEEILELKKKLDRLETNKISYNSKSDVNKLIADFSETKKFDNYIIKKLVEKIEIGKDGEVKITLKV